MLHVSSLKKIYMEKPFWKKAPYSGSSASRHKRTKFTNAPLNFDWMLDAIGEVPKLADVSGRLYANAVSIVVGIANRYLALSSPSNDKTIRL